MTEANRAPDNETSVAEHPLYQTALELLAAGEEVQAAENLRELAEIYPGDRELDNLLVRVELKAAFADAEYRSDGRSKPTPILRQVVLLLLTLTLALIIIVGLVVVWGEYIQPILDNAEREQRVSSLRVQAAVQLEAGALDSAEEKYEEILTNAPGDQAALEALAEIERQRELRGLVADARRAMEQGDLRGAESLVLEVQARDPDYPGAQALLAEIRERIGLEETWQAAQDSVAAEDWQAAIDLLLQIRAEDAAYRRQEVEGLLFQAYVALARQLIQGANADPGPIYQAIDYCNKALNLRPGDRNLRQECRLADQFVEGADAYSREEFAQAVDAWEEVYETEPAYQNGVLDGILDEAYPQAAREQLARANGSVGALGKAIYYMEKARERGTLPEDLRQELDLATAYVAGSDAFAAEDWNAAVALWGPISALRPDYGNGALGDNLRQACANSAEPDATYCSP